MSRFFSMGLSQVSYQVLSKFEPFGFGSITSFQIQEPLNSVPCIHYTFPNAKDYVNTKFSYIFLTHFFIFSRIQLSAAGMKFKGALSRNLHTSETLSVQWPDWLPISLWSKQDWRSLSWNYTHHWERSPLKSPFTSTGQLIIFIKAILFGL